MDFRAGLCEGRQPAFKHGIAGCLLIPGGRCGWMVGLNFRTQTIEAVMAQIRDQAGVS